MLSSKIFFNNTLTPEDRVFADSIFEKMKNEYKSGDIGYYFLPFDEVEATKIERFLENNELIKSQKLKNLFVVGIGGSSLGTKAVDAALKKLPVRKNINLQFLENCDPVILDRELDSVDPSESLTILISKSGSTIETASNTKVLFEKFGVLKSSNISNHLCVVTDEGSPMDAFAKELGVSTFYIYKNVGGRFSVLSAVGLLPLAILGYDIRALLDGAKKMNERFFSKEDNTILEKAFFYTSMYKTYNINVLFSYYTDLFYLNAWYTQLWAESLGKINKRGDRVGLTPVGLVGSIDQHSFLQLIIEGPRDKTVTFVKVKDFENNLKVPQISLKHIEKTDYVNGIRCFDLLNHQCDATLETLHEIEVPVDLLELDKVCESSIGELIYYFELLTSASGAFFGIDTYIQDGVELGKKRLLEKLK